jgi:hypothetical protein
MIPKSGHRFSEKIIPKQAKAKCQFHLKSFRFSAPHSSKREVRARAALRGLKSLHPWLTEGLNAIVASSLDDASR